MEIVTYHRICQRQMLGVGEGVPRPGGQRLERNALVVIEILERLQSGRVDGEGEIAVAHAERALRIHARDPHGMAMHERLTVDGRRPAGCDRENEECEQGGDSKHAAQDKTGG